MKKHFLKSFAFFAMLFSALNMSAKQYCGETMTSTAGWTGQYKLSAEKVSDTQSRLTISVIGEERITGFHQLVIQNFGGGTASKWIFDPNDSDFSNAELFSVAADGKSAVINVNWTTYPSSDVQIYLILRRNNSAGGADIFGNTITDLNLLTACDGSGDGSGESNEPLHPTPPASSGIDWSTYNWVDHLSYSSYENQYKVETGCVQSSPIQIQENSGIGIYMTFAMAIKSCSINESKFEGSGLLLYLSALTAEETYVTVIFYDDTKCSFWVYKANDAGGGGGEPEPIDWGNFSWLDHNGFNAYANQFKSNSTCCEVLYIQEYNDKECIYVRFPREITTCNIPHYKEGGQLYIPLTSLEAKETPITVKMVTGEICSFYLYNDKGTTTPTIVPGVCVYEGGAGDALMEQPGRDQFESGYRITLTLDEADTDKIHITATVLDKDAHASSACFQNYPNYNYSEVINEHRFEGSDRNTFETTISISSLISNRADGIIRFAIKFEYPNGVIKVTTPEFFYLDGSGCAQRVFAIYHHDDLPATPLEGEDQFTEFAGGRILQSIQYKRRMPSEVWETLSVPFDVESVTAFDPATGEHVPLHAQYNHNGATKAGHYWLRYFKTKEVTASNFQPNWYDIEATSEEAAKPKKDTPYIIRLPNGGGYYNDKYIVFHGRGYQTIVDTYNAPSLPADDHYSYSGNNTMMPQYLSKAYVLDNAGYYFTSSSTVTLYPFECSVNATEPTIARMPRIALNGRNNTTTDLTLLPTTDLQGGVIYSIFGAAVARFNTIDEYDQACQNLAAGVYVIVTPSTTTKIQIP